MRTPFFLACLFVLTSGSLAEAARPRVAPGEPEYRRERSPFNGDVEWRQTFEGAPITIGLSDWTIAKRYYLTKRLKNSVPSFSVRVGCSIAPGGRVDPICVPLTEINQGQRSLLIDLLISSGSKLPVFRAVVEQEGIYRNVNFDVTVPMVSPPDLKLDVGEIIDLKLVPEVQTAISSRFSADSYPPAAIRAEATGHATFECQVQIDYSPICSLVQFLPPENAGYFVDIGREMAIVRVHPKLSDGRDSAGMRFRFSINFQIPNS